MNAVEVTLLQKTVGYNEIGVKVETVTRKTVIGNASSVSAQEFFRAGEQGLKPEVVIKLWQADYSGEEKLEYSGKQYSIYRNYMSKDGRVELYCQKDVGDV